MGGGYYSNPFEFLIATLGGLYIGAVMLRFLLQAVRADFYNPISQFLVRITNPPLLPLRRLIPGFGGVDVAAIVLMLLLQMALFGAVALLRGALPSPLALLLAAVFELLFTLLNIYFFAIIIQAILSWVQPGPGHPASQLLWQLTEPVLRPARRLLPPISGLDLSPVLVLIGIKFVELLLKNLIH